MGLQLLSSRAVRGMYFAALEAETEVPGEEVLLDLNELAEGHDFFSLGASSVSPDGNLGHRRCRPANRSVHQSPGHQPRTLTAI